MEEQPFDFSTPITEDITLVAQFDCPAGVTLTQFKAALDDGTAATTYPAGTQIDDTTNGNYDPWIVGHYGAEYNAPNHHGGYLYRKYLYSANQPWGTADHYADSAIHAWLNSTYLEGCSDEIKNLVKQINVPVVSGSVPAKMFLMSGVETMCLSGSIDAGIAWDSWKNRTGLTAPSTAANAGRRMSEGELTNGHGSAWYLRSVGVGVTGVAEVTSDGACRITALPNTPLGVAVACFIPAGTNEPITAQELNALNITAQDYNAKGITADEFNTDAKGVLS